MKLYIPCKYLMLMHMNSPNRKFCSIMGMIVKGIQKTATSRSLTDKFNRNTFVTVRILLFCISVTITNKFPTTAKINMSE